MKQAKRVLLGNEGLDKCLQVLTLSKTRGDIGAPDQLESGLVVD